MEVERVTFVTAEMTKSGVTDDEVVKQVRGVVASCTRERHADVDVKVERTPGTTTISVLFPWGAELADDFREWLAARISEAATKSANSDEELIVNLVTANPPTDEVGELATALAVGVVEDAETFTHHSETYSAAATITQSLGAGPVVYYVTVFVGKHSASGARLQLGAAERDHLRARIEPHLRRVLPGNHELRVRVMSKPLADRRGVHLDRRRAARVEAAVRDLAGRHAPTIMAVEARERVDYDENVGREVATVTVTVTSRNADRLRSEATTGAWAFELLRRLHENRAVDTRHDARFTFVDEAAAERAHMLHRTVNDYVRRQLARDGVVEVVVHESVDADGQALPRVGVTLFVTDAAAFKAAHGVDAGDVLTDELCEGMGFALLNVAVRSAVADEHPALGLRPPVSAGVFIDAPNVNENARAAGWAIDYAKLREVIAARYECRRPRYYDCWGVASNYKSGSRFRNAAGTVIDRDGKPVVVAGKRREIDAVIRDEYDVVTRAPKLTKRADERAERLTPKNNLDADVIIDALEQANSWQVFVLFSGDGDYRDLITRLLELRKDVHVYSFRRALSPELRDLADMGLISLFALDDYADRIKLTLH